jgi:internalin A
MADQPPRRMTSDEQASNAEDVAQERIFEWKRNLEEFGPRIDGKGRFGAKTRMLDLEHLGLRTIPEGLRELRELEHLSLSRNQLRALPAWIGELSALKSINLSKNWLRRLPPEMGLLRGLIALNLTQNELIALPEALWGLPLRELKLHKNPDLDLPGGLLERPPGEILRYYLSSRGDIGGPLLELKLLLVGRGGSGKTTLVKRLASEQPDEREPETHSIAIRELMLQCERGFVQARAWDFGGQEILHATHRFFLTERSLYLLVLEPRFGMAQRDADYWLKMIETQGGGSPVIVVMNWSHKRLWQVDEVKLRRKFPFIVDFLATDAFHGDGIEKLRSTMVRAVEQMPDVWSPFPHRWREIKDAVAGMRDNFLTYRQYSTLCDEWGEYDSKAKADLAGILHALGLALYFGRDPRLHDTRVLNPRWVTGGVYAVIRAPSVRSRNGQLDVSDMPRVLSEAEQEGVIRASDYPSSTHRFILELMRAFQLCYASDEEGKSVRYLVPELLSEFEPNMEATWDNAPVRLRYRYDMLPPGLLPRFIVRTHSLSDDAPHWRHGVVLRHAEAAALIREETDRPELHVFIIGQNADMRRLLVAMVRRELESLHVELKMQPIEELELTGEGEQWISVKALREVERPETPKQKLPIQPEGTAEVHVSRELNKLIPAQARAIDRDPEIAPLPVRVFVSYAHDDERRLKRLDLMLHALEQYHSLVSWRDRRLIAGDEWDVEIRSRLEEMDIFLFIASQTSLVRPYIRDPELARARQRWFANEIEIVIVKLEPCACEEDSFLRKFQRLAPNLNSVVEASPRSKAWEQVRKDLLPVIKRVRKKKEEAALRCQGDVPNARR